MVQYTKNGLRMARMENEVEVILCIAVKLVWKKYLNLHIQAYCNSCENDVSSGILRVSMFKLYLFSALIHV